MRVVVVVVVVGHENGRFHFYFFLLRLKKVHFVILHINWNDKQITN